MDQGARDLRPLEHPLEYVPTARSAASARPTFAIARLGGQAGAGLGVVASLVISVGASAILVQRYRTIGA